MFQHATDADDTDHTNRRTVGRLHRQLRSSRRRLGRRAWPAVLAAIFLLIAACGDGDTVRGRR